MRAAEAQTTTKMLKWKNKKKGPIMIASDQVVEEAECDVKGS